MCPAYLRALLTEVSDDLVPEIRYLTQKRAAIDTLLPVPPLFSP